MDAHVVSATTDGASETVPSLGFAMHPLDSPTMSLIEMVFMVSPSEPLAPRSKQRWVVNIEYDHTAWRERGSRNVAQGTGPTAFAIRMEVLKRAPLQLALGRRIFQLDSAPGCA
ncbi:hypothetical protein LMTR3_21670 [Bradyrhizobium sp. LMTR 3]|nr:hypothetical protein LMTR3_21670 [Bradyrhizobium sp. LMTR 3]